MNEDTKGNTNYTNAGNRAIVIGDAMVDSYLDCQAVGISDEAPVTVLDWQRTKRVFGGMLNAAKSLRTLDFDTHVFGAVNEDDDAGSFIHVECGKLGIHEHWVTDGRPTTEKSRIGVNLDKSASEHIARVDVECDDPLDDDRRAQLQDALKMVLEDQYEGGTVVVVSDYMKGVMDEGLARWLVENCIAMKIPILVDAKPNTLDWYRGASLLTPNEEEARAYLLRKCERSMGISGGGLQGLAETLALQLKSRVILTAAEKGVFLANDEGGDSVKISVEHFEACSAGPVISTSGAGDVLLAMMALSAVRGESWADGVAQAQQMVGLTVGRGGTCAIEADDLEGI